jgi:hypothetical protein
MNVKMKTKWNWKIFLLCPLLSLLNGLYIGCWIFLVPSVIIGTLLMLMQVPFLGIISLVLLILINLLCACLAAIISAVVSHLFGDDVLNYYIITNTISVVYYLLCSAFITMISYDYLQNRSRHKMSSININSKKWSAVELLMIIPLVPLVVTINYVNALMIRMSLQLMGG